jgi:hypothetical protein
VSAEGPRQQILPLAPTEGPRFTISFHGDGATSRASRRPRRRFRADTRLIRRGARNGDSGDDRVHARSVRHALEAPEPASGLLLALLRERGA